MRLLLVNPWIADFAAFNFWVRPLGLYAVAEWLDSLGEQVILLDCLSPFKAPGRFRREQVSLPISTKLPIKRSFARYGIERSEFRRRLHQSGRFDAVFITSVMSYWYPGISWVVKEIRKEIGNVPIILGGIYATLWTEHARSNLQVDLVCKGSLEVNKEKICNFLGLSGLQKDKRAWYKLPIWDGVDYCAVRTAIGCPFRCTYCASRILAPRFSQRPVDEVIRELMHLKRIGVRQVAFYDDALLVDFNQRLGPILDELERRQIRFSFHTPNGLHARLINEQVAKRLVEAGFKSVRLSLETVNANRQKETGGKVSSVDLERAISHLLKAGMKPSAIGVYLLVGLPGQDLDEVEESIRYVKALGVRPYLAEFSPIPGTLEWDRLEDQGVVSRSMDPLLTNNTIFFRLFTNYDMDRFRALKLLAAS